MESILKVIVEILSNIYDFINYGLKFNHSKKQTIKTKIRNNSYFLIYNVVISYF